MVMEEVNVPKTPFQVKLEDRLCKGNGKCWECLLQCFHFPLL